MALLNWGRQRRVHGLWKTSIPQYLQEAQDAAVLAAVRDQERAGLDIVTDGEMRRESYSNFFVLRASPGSTSTRPGAGAGPQPATRSNVPRVVGPIRRRGAPSRYATSSSSARRLDRLVKGHAARAVHDVAAGEERVLRATRRRAAVSRSLDAVREEIADLFAAAPTSSSSTSPGWSRAPTTPRAYGIETLQRALDGITGTTALHICFRPTRCSCPDHAPPLPLPAQSSAAAPVDQISIETAQADLDVSVLEQLAGKTIILGVIALDSEQVETPEVVAGRIETRPALHPGSRRRPGLRHDPVPSRAHRRTRSWSRWWRALEERRPQPSPSPRTG